MSKLKVYFQSQDNFLNQTNQDFMFEDGEKISCLSIITATEEKFELNKNFLLSKQVVFEDTDNENNPNALSDAMALDIVQHLISVVESDSDIFIVHCFAGVSRSRAVALFIKEVLLNQPLADIQKTPYSTHNRFVYRKLVKAYEQILGAYNES